MSEMSVERISTDTEVTYRAEWLIKAYMRANQMIYAIVAFPIGTVLSITPIFLHKERDVSVVNIGYVMAAGELLGIFGMILAEHSENGFVFRRPYDLYFINVALALSLMMIPVWPKQIWYLSGVFMMLVQTFNSASKPVVSESIHRLATLRCKEPHIVFAQANMWRRTGNSIMGFFTPLFYEIFFMLPFFLIGGVILLFLVACMAMDFKIKSICDDDETEDARHSEKLKEFSKRVSVAAGSQQSLAPSVSSSSVSSNPKNRGRMSTISLLTSYSTKIYSSRTQSTDARLEEFDDGNDSSTFNVAPVVDTVRLERMDNRHLSSLRMDSDFGVSNSLTKSSRSKVSQSLTPVIMEEGDEENDLEQDTSKTTKVDVQRESCEEDKNFEAQIQRSIQVDTQDYRKNIRRISSLGMESDRSTTIDSLDDSTSSSCSKSNGTPNDSLDNSTNRKYSKLHELRSSQPTIAPIMEACDEEFGTERSIIHKIHKEEREYEQGVRRRINKSRRRKFALSYYLIVWFFPFWDAVISRLPFSFLMIFIVDELGIRIMYAGFILFGYQMGRAVAQQIQKVRCDRLVNYILNGTALLAYIIFVLITHFSPNTKLWFLPILFTGFAETLPIQQLYMMGLFSNATQQEMKLRKAVQVSHTFTGVGSMISFLAGSQIYYRFEIKGAAYLGVAIMVLKIVTNILIDSLLVDSERKSKLFSQEMSAREECSEIFASVQFVN